MQFFTGVFQVANMVRNDSACEVWSGKLYYLILILYSMGTSFAALSASLVRMFAPYASKRGVIATVFIKANLWWCRYRKFSKLGQYPVTEVLVVTAITAIIAYPNPYTRMNTSQLIYLLFSQCSISNSDNLWFFIPLYSDYNRNFTDVNSAIEIAAARSWSLQGSMASDPCPHLQINHDDLHFRYEGSMWSIYTISLLGRYRWKNSRH
ncbi:hypothetical protein NQ317_019025, partial [Molorchus minor]